MEAADIIKQESRRKEEPLRVSTVSSVKTWSPSSKPQRKGIDHNGLEEEETQEPAHGGSDEDDEEVDDDEDNEEPRLKYAQITPIINPVYRNRDATSTFMIAGNKMIVGTHNGNIHVYSLPLFQRLRVYHAHSASVDSISVSPFPPPTPSEADLVPMQLNGKAGSPLPENNKGLKQQNKVVIPATQSNSIHIGSSSMDGNVCVASLVDPKDVSLRNFGRPVESVALSPEYRHDKIYLSGGKAGNLILTTGAPVGSSSTSTTTGASNSGPGWLNSLGLGQGGGKDRVLHSGEGTISSIKWSISGKYVAWVNEEGIKIMRSHLHLENGEAENAWERFGHTDRPRSKAWDDMASVWKPRVGWIDEDSLEHGDAPHENSGASQWGSIGKKSERLLVGWGGTIWIIKVSPSGNRNAAGKRKAATAEIVTKLRTDCIISGVSLYTQNLLLVLSYIIPDEDEAGSSNKGTGHSRGIRRRRNGLQPELRLIDIETEEEISNDTLTFRQFESLSASDYHLDIAPPNRTSTVTRRGALENIRSGILDVTLYPARLFSSGASSRSNETGRKASTVKSASIAESAGVLHDGKYGKEMEFAAAQGPKVYIHSPYDCIVAVTRGLDDRLSWLVSNRLYREAWELISEHADSLSALQGESPPGTPTPTQENGEISFTNETMPITMVAAGGSAKLKREKSRIGELWLKQLISEGKWAEAAGVCRKVLQATPAWEQWLWVFIRNGKFDEISPHVPIDIQPPLSSLIYELILGHYVSHDLDKFHELIEAWPFHLFEIDSIIAAIFDQVDSPSVTEDSDEWKILSGSLAALYLEGGHYRKALKWYIRLQDGDTVMRLIQEYHLLDSVVEDIPGFILLQVPKNRLKTAEKSELEEATLDPIKLLAREAANGIVHPETVISQLLSADLSLFLYFYLRVLWKGEFLTDEEESKKHTIIRARRHHHQTSTELGKLATDEGRTLIDPFADTAVELFASHDRPLLMEFLQSNTAYSYDTASSICESRHFTPELIYLFSKTGQTKRALYLILSDLGNIHQAISFAKAQDDPESWEDLLSFSMDKPEYIRALLTDASTAIDPIKLVRRIPSGLEIEGLREGLTRMIREHDIQASISQGVARVLAGEVAIRMDVLRKGQRRGIKFDVVQVHSETLPTPPQDNTGGNGPLEESEKNNELPLSTPGRCAGCGEAFVEQETETLVGFACGHIFHLSHLHEQPEPTTSAPPSTHDDHDGDTAQVPFSRSVGLKVTNARLLRDKFGAGCRICSTSLRPEDDECE